MQRFPSFRPLSILTVFSLLTSPVSAQTGASGGEWRHYRGGPGSTGYAPLDQIRASNVADLQIAWEFSTADFGRRPEFKNSSTPLMVDGVLYATAGSDRSVVALDAGTGELLWSWSLDEGERGRVAPRANSGRGVAYWADGQGDGRIFTATPGFRLVALDARTGEPVESFGDRGMIDLKAQIGADTLRAIIGSSSPPLVSRDAVVVGPALAIGLRPPSKENVKGTVQAFDVRTGNPLWSFTAIPERGAPGSETWERDSWSYTGNAGVWAPMSVDEDLGLVYLPVEAATSDHYGGHRLGDNLFSTSLVALDIETGEMRWYYQLVHHDIWDWDVPTFPILLDVEVEGRPVKAVAQLTKQAFAYVFDRTNGEPVWPIEERPVPASDVPGERASPTQPFPSKPAAYDRQGVTEDVFLDFTPELRAQALEAVAGFRMGPLFSPPSLAEAPDGTRGQLTLPHSTDGGSNWEGGAADPETGILYVASVTELGSMSLREREDTAVMRYNSAFGAPRGPERLPLVKPPYGRITAIDLNTGDHLWVMANGDTPPEVRDHPLLEGVELPRTGSPSRAGLLVTKTLLFAGEGYGGQPWFRAHDKRTGEILAELELPGAQTGLPMTYMHEGAQYVVMSVAGGRGRPARFVAFALP